MILTKEMGGEYGGEKISYYNKKEKQFYGNGCCCRIFSCISLWDYSGICKCALALWVEYSRDIYLKENKIEFYQNKNLITTIKYSNIATLAVEEGNEDKNKKKEYVTIAYRETSNKKNSDKNAKIKKYYISPSYYCANDFKMIKEVIKSKNSEVKFNENLSKYIKEQYI